MLERMNLEYNLMVKQFESELKELHSTRNNLELIANKSIEDQSIMHTKTEIGSNKIIDALQYRALVKVIEELYKQSSESRITEDELANSTPLQLLEQVESILDHYKEKFDLYCEVDSVYA